MHGNPLPISKSSARYMPHVFVMVTLDATTRMCLPRTNTGPASAWYPRYKHLVRKACHIMKDLQSCALRFGRRKPAKAEETRQHPFALTGRPPLLWGLHSAPAVRKHRPNSVLAPSKNLHIQPSPLSALSQPGWRSTIVPTAPREPTTPRPRKRLWLLHLSIQSLRHRRHRGSEQSRHREKAIIAKAPFPLPWPFR
jgi:hypothetical protein